MPVLGLHLLNGLQKGGLGKIVRDSSAGGWGATQGLTTGHPSQALARQGTGRLSSSAGLLGFLTRFSRVTSLRSD